MEKKRLVRRASAPVVGPRSKRPSLQPSLFRGPAELKVAWESLPILPSNCSQEFSRCASEFTSHRSNSSNNDIKLPCIEGRIKRNVEEGERKMNTSSKTKLTERTVNLPENRRLTAKFQTTYQRRNSTPSQFVWRNDRPEEQSKALREFIKNAEDNFDSTKEKAVVILNWLSTQSLTTQWIKPTGQ